MASMPIITGRVLIKFIKSIGYKLDRQKGNHRIFKHDYNKTLTISAYKKKTVKVGLLGSILKNIGISKTEFLNSIK